MNKRIIFGSILAVIGGIGFTYLLNKYLKKKGFGTSDFPHKTYPEHITQTVIGEASHHDIQGIQSFSADWITTY